MGLEYTSQTSTGQRASRSAQLRFMVPKWAHTGDRNSQRKRLHLQSRNQQVNDTRNLAFI